MREYVYMRGTSRMKRSLSTHGAEASLGKFKALFVHMIRFYHPAFDTDRHYARKQTEKSYIYTSSLSASIADPRSHGSNTR
jgi:hypothetical protein